MDGLFIGGLPIPHIQETCLGRGSKLNGKGHLPVGLAGQRCCEKWQTNRQWDAEQ